MTQTMPYPNGTTAAQCEHGLKTIITEEKLKQRIPADSSITHSEMEN